MNVLDDLWCGNLYELDTLEHFIRSTAQEHEMSITLKALDLALEKHNGQYRKRPDPSMKKVPYVTHPMMLVMHAWSMGWMEDELTAELLLHDVCEDCGIDPAQLDMPDSVKEVVGLVTKSPLVAISEEAEDHYYLAIRTNKNAMIVKLLDRCHNVAGMATGFDRRKLVDYIYRTRRDFYPMLAQAEKEYPEDSPRWFLIRYHMCSIVESLNVVCDKKP